MFKKPIEKMSPEEQKAISRIAYSMLFADGQISRKELSKVESFGMNRQQLLDNKEGEIDDAIAVIGQSDEKVKTECKKLIDKIMGADKYHSTGEDKLNIKINEAWGFD